MKNNEYLRYEVTSPGDFEHCLVNFYELPPGKYNYPYHYHTQNTEVFYILRGKLFLKHRTVKSRSARVISSYSRWGSKAPTACATPPTAKN